MVDATFIPRHLRHAVNVAAVVVEKLPPINATPQAQSAAAATRSVTTRDTSHMRQHVTCRADAAASDWRGCGTTAAPCKGFPVLTRLASATFQKRAGFPRPSDSDEIVRGK